VLIRKIKPNFKSLGPRYGKDMKAIASEISRMTQSDIAAFEDKGVFMLNISDNNIHISLDDVEVISEDIPGWLVTNEGNLTVALDIKITEDLRYEGIAREFVNRIQNYRKESGFEVTDKINISILKHQAINKAIEKHSDYISVQTLAVKVQLVDHLPETSSKKVELEEDVITRLKITRID